MADAEEPPPPLEWDGTNVPALLELDHIDTHHFRSRRSQRNVNDSLYGGQVFAQALAAAAETVDGRLVHSCHGYFLRPGQVLSRVDYFVERVRDGGSFSNRRIVARQKGEAILHMDCSFATAHDGFDHQRKASDPPHPDQLQSLNDMAQMNDDRVPAFIRKYLDGPHPLEIRPANGMAAFLPDASSQRCFWVRVPSATGIDDPSAHRILLAYLSDFWFSTVALMPHAPPIPSEALRIASIDHAIWFHRPVRTCEWLLYDTDSPTACNGIGLARGIIYDINGRLVATTMQEALHKRR